MARKVVLTRRGVDMEYVFPSMVACAKAVGRSVDTVKARMEDGFTLFTDRQVPVRVKELKEGEE